MITSYNSINSIDAQIEELKKRRDALASGLCYIPLPSYESMIDPYNLGSCPEPIAYEYKVIDNDKDNIQRR